MMIADCNLKSSQVFNWKLCLDLLKADQGLDRKCKWNQESVKKTSSFNLKKLVQCENKGFTEVIYL